MTVRHLRRRLPFRRFRRSIQLIAAGGLIALFASVAVADNTRTVTLKISVIDDQDKDVERATVVVTPEGGDAMTVQTDGKGNATATVTVAAAKFSERWLGAAGPTITLVATKDSASVQKTLTLRSKDFKGGNSAELNCTVVLTAPPPPTTTQLTVNVKDELGKAVNAAHINVYQSFGRVKAFRKGIVAPADYQQPTNAQGVAQFTLTVPAGGGLDLAIEVAHEDMASESGNLTVNAPVPSSLPEQSFVLKKRTASGGTDVISVVVDVQSEGKPLEGARVVVRDEGLGAVTGRFPGVTDSNGKATIAVWYATPDASKTFPVDVSKPGYKDGGGSVALTKKDIGRTIAGPSITLQKESRSGTVVTVNVVDAKTKQPIGGALVTLDGPGYHYDNTNGSGTVSFVVPETGEFEVRVTEENHRPFKSSVRVLANEKDKPPVVCEMEPKFTKDEGKDVIEVTVLGKDTTDPKSAPAPLKEARVRAGNVSVGTDENGKAKLQGAFEEKQEVTVEAKNYKSQSKVVNVAKVLHFSAGTGTATFTLEPELSEESPIRIIIEVVDVNGTPIEGANVKFTASNGTFLREYGTKKKGEVDFRSSDAPGVPLAELRKGILVDVTKRSEYKDVLGRSVPSNLLRPSLEAGRYRIELERDWAGLEKAIAALEGRVAALRKEVQDAAAKAQAIQGFVSNCTAALKRTEAILEDLKKARADADKKLSADACKEAKEIAKTLERLKQDVDDAEKELKSELDEAIKLAAICKSKEEAEKIRSKHRHAISLAGKIGKMEKQAQAQREKLAKIAEGLKPDRATTAKFQEAIDKIELEVSSAGKDAVETTNSYDPIMKLVKSLPGRRAELVAALDQLLAEHHVRENETLLPRDLRKRLENLEAALRSGGSDMSLFSAPVVDEAKFQAVKDAVTRLQEYKNEAVAIAKDYEEKSTCDVAMKDADFVMNVIGKDMVGIMIELGAAADLRDKADACERGLTTASPSPTADDQVTVPDVSGFNEVGAMKAAAGPDLVGVIVATKATPPPGTKKLFAFQDPAAGSKAKRGSTLKIFIFQSLATAASPTPSPTPTPAGDDIVVPDISTANGNDIAAMKAAAGPDMVGVIVATKATPPPGTTKLFAGQDPPAGTKSKRGKTLKIFVYQSLAQASATPSPSATPSASPSATPSPSVTPGTMPDLTGLTLDQAIGRLPEGLRVNNYEGGDKPPKPELAYTIFSQSPPPGTKLDLKNPPVVTVKVYGSGTTSAPSDGADPFVGVWAGVTIYKSAATEITISKAPEYGEREYSILVHGHTYPYPAKSDGTRLSHESGIYKISYTRVGDTLVGDWQYTDIKGRVTTGKSILKKK